MSIQLISLMIRWISTKFSSTSTYARISPVFCMISLHILDCSLSSPNLCSFISLNFLSSTGTVKTCINLRKKRNPVQIKQIIINLLLLMCLYCPRNKGKFLSLLRPDTDNKDVLYNKKIKITFKTVKRCQIRIPKPDSVKKNRFVWVCFYSLWRWSFC